MAQIRFKNVEKSYGQFAALDNIDLVVADGEFLTLLGPSGCGKSTTLRLIAGFVEPSAGQIFIDDDDVTGLPPQQRAIGMVFQDYALFPHMTIAENIAFGPRERGMRKSERNKRVAELLALVRLEGLGSRYPSQLSGGQQQRVALARALAFPPRVLLMDEPLGALDLKLRETMQEEIKRIHQELKVTTVYVTHDQAEAIYLSDRIGVMNAGRVVQIGHPQDIYRAPNSRFAAGFIGKINFIAGHLSRLDEHLAAIDVAGQTLKAPSRSNFSVGDQVTIAVRPENLVITACDTTLSDGDRLVNRLPATLLSRSFSGNLTYVKLGIKEGETLLAEIRSTSALPEDGALVDVSWNPADTIVLRD